MGRREEISVIDIIKINRKYKCKGEQYDKGDDL